VDDLVKWGLLSGAAVIAYFLRSLHNRFERHLEDCAKRDLSIAEVRASASATAMRMDDMCERLDRIDGKLDRLIERGGRA